VRSAKAAGIYTIAVNTGKLNDDILLNEGCDVLYASTSDMVEALKATSVN
jgi:phosphoglycolate phosphatase-like HAD superfamily hydrolase